MNIVSNVPVDVVRILREIVPCQGLTPFPFLFTNRMNAVLLTANKDFGELAFHQRLINQGVVLIRLAGLSPTNKAGVVASVIKNHLSELPQAFSVITPGAIRIRRRIP